MDDAEILRLLTARDERGLKALREQYAQSCRKIALQYVSAEDADEVLDDVLLGAWNAIPPQKPENLFGFLAALTKNIAVSRCRKQAAAKRGAGESPAPLDELADCIPGTQNVEQHVEERQLADALNRFLSGLPKEMRAVTVLRYTEQQTVAEIAAAFGISESKVKSILYRARKKLRRFLEKEEWL